MSESVNAVPAFDYRRELSRCRAETDDAIRRVLDSGQLILGPEVQAFEHEFAAAIGVRHAVGVASGTDALILALRALEIGSGHQVITVANTAVPTVSAIRAVGAQPRFAEIDGRTLQMCSVSLKDAVSSAGSGDGDVAAVEESATPKEPVRDELGRSYATGKRKDAVARVWIMRKKV